MAYLRYLSFSRLLGWETGCDGPKRKPRSGCSRPGGWKGERFIYPIAIVRSAALLSMSVGHCSNQEES